MPSTGRASGCYVARTMSPRPSGHPPLPPVPTGLRIIESLTILLLALMAFLLALK